MEQAGPSDVYYKPLIDSYRSLRAFQESTQKKIVNQTQKGNLKPERVSIYDRLLDYFELVISHTADDNDKELKLIDECDELCNFFRYQVGTLYALPIEHIFVPLKKSEPVMTSPVLGLMSYIYNVKLNECWDKESSDERFLRKRRSAGQIWENFLTAFSDGIRIYVNDASPGAKLSRFQELVGRSMIPFVKTAVVSSMDFKSNIRIGEHVKRSLLDAVEALIGGCIINKELLKSPEFFGPSFLSDVILLHSDFVTANIALQIAFTVAPLVKSRGRPPKNETKETFPLKARLSWFKNIFPTKTFGKNLAEELVPRIVDMKSRQFWNEVGGIQARIVRDHDKKARAIPIVSGEIDKKKLLWNDEAIPAFQNNVHFNNCSLTWCSLALPDSNSEDLGAEVTSEVDYNDIISTELQIESSNSSGAEHLIKLVFHLRNTPHIDGFRKPLPLNFKSKGKKSSLLLFINSRYDLMLVRTLKNREIKFVTKNKAGGPLLKFLNKENVLYEGKPFGSTNDVTNQNGKDEKLSAKISISQEAVEAIDAPGIETKPSNSHERAAEVQRDARSDISKDGSSQNDTPSVSSLSSMNSVNQAEKKPITVEAPVKILKKERKPEKLHLQDSLSSNFDISREFREVIEKPNTNISSLNSSPQKNKNLRKFRPRKAVNQAFSSNDEKTSKTESLKVEKTRNLVKLITSPHSNELLKPQSDEVLDFQKDTREIKRIEEVDLDALGKKIEQSLNYKAGSQINEIHSSENVNNKKSRGLKRHVSYQSAELVDFMKKPEDEEPINAKKKLKSSNRKPPGISISSLDDAFNKQGSKDTDKENSIQLTSADSAANHEYLSAKMSSYSKSKHSNFLHNLIHHESDKAMTFPEVEESKDSIVEVSEGSIDSRNNEVFFASQDPISSFSSPKENDSQIAIRNTWRKLPQNHLLENARKTELTKGIPINEYKATNNNEDNRPGLNLRPNNSKLRYEHSTSGKIKPDKVIFPSKKKDFDWKRLQKLRFDLSSPRQSAEINDDSTDGSRSGELSASEFTKFKAESSNLSLVKNYKTPNSETTYRKEKQDEKSGPNFSRTNTKLESFNSILKDLRGDMTQKFQKTPPTVDQGIVASDEVSSIKDAVRIKSRPNKQLFARLRPPRSKLLLKSSSDVRKIRGNQQKLADLTNPSYKGCLGNQKISKSSVIRNGSTVSNSIKHEDKLSDCMGKLTQMVIKSLERKRTKEKYSANITTRGLSNLTMKILGDCIKESESLRENLIHRSQLRHEKYNEYFEKTKKIKENLGSDLVHLNEEFCQKK